MHRVIRKVIKFFCKSTYVALAVSVSASMSYAAPKETFADRYAAIVIDANSGKTLFDQNGNARRYPASLTKMMTLYMLFEAMQSGRVSPNTPIPVSAYAAARPPTKIGFKPGQTITANAAAKALITKSANDVASAIAEYLGGSEPRFAQMMTTKARRLGMMNTNFANASGLPDTKNYSTARDMALLSLALREHFPRQYGLFTTTSFQYRGKTINGHNRLVKTMKGVDGIKTGYTRMSGFNLASSMRMNDKSIVAVVMGGRNAALRDQHMAMLLRTYIAKASSKRAAAPLVASRAFVLPEGNEVPIPVAKAGISDREHDAALLTALASSSAPSSPAATAANNIVIKNPPTPVRKTGRNVDPVVTSAVETTTKASGGRGWVIQIASLPNKNEAEDILSKASTAGGKLLARAKPYTQTFNQGDENLYRARFAGFKSKQAAWNACTILQKADFNCYAVQD